MEKRSTDFEYRPALARHIWFGSHQAKFMAMLRLFKEARRVRLVQGPGIADLLESEIYQLNSVGCDLFNCGGQIHKIHLHLFLTILFSTL